MDWDLRVAFKRKFKSRITTSVLFLSLHSARSAFLGIMLSLIIPVGWFKFCENAAKGENELGGSPVIPREDRGSGVRRRGIGDNVDLSSTNSVIGQMDVDDFAMDPIDAMIVKIIMFRICEYLLRFLCLNVLRKCVNPTTAVIE